MERQCAIVDKKLEDEEIAKHTSAGHQWPGQGKKVPGLPGWQRCRAAAACPAFPTGASLPPPPPHPAQKMTK